MTEGSRVCKDRLPACYPRTHAHMPSLFPFAPARLPAAPGAGGPGPRQRRQHLLHRRVPQQRRQHRWVWRGCSWRPAGDAGLRLLRLLLLQRLPLLAGWSWSCPCLCLPACLPACLPPTADLPSLTLPPLPHCPTASGASPCSRARVPPGAAQVWRCLCTARCSRNLSRRDGRHLLRETHVMVA
jgi:hypothetical protein